MADLHNMIALQAVRMAGKTGLLVEDLIQEGYVGLLKAEQTYDPGRGASFTTHAWWQIRGSITAYVRREARHGWDDESLDEEVDVADEGLVERHELVAAPADDMEHAAELAVLKDLLPYLPSDVRAAVLGEVDDRAARTRGIRWLREAMGE